MVSCRVGRWGLPCVSESEGLFDTPLANLWLTQAGMTGLDVERFVDSTGEIGAFRA